MSFAKFKSNVVVCLRICGTGCLAYDCDGESLDVGATGGTRCILPPPRWEGGVGERERTCRYGVNEDFVGLREVQV